MIQVHTGEPLLDKNQVTGVSKDLPQNALSKSRNIFSSSRVYFLLLTLITGIILYYRLSFQMLQGPGWDPYDYLVNALEFAGRGIGTFVENRPPLLSFLCSLVFRMGFVSDSVILYLDGLFYIVATLGIFQLFKMRFGPTPSFFASLLFASFPLVLGLTTQGYTDLPSVALSIWTVYFLMLAVDMDSRYYLVAIPLYVLSFMMRFTAGLMLFPILIYVSFKANILRDLKRIATGFLLSTLILVPYLAFCYIRFGNAFFQLQTVFATTMGPPAKESGFYEPNPFWYINRSPSYLAGGKIGGLPTNKLLIWMIICGLALFAYRHLVKSKKPKVHHLILLSLTAVFVVTFSRLSYPYSQVILALWCIAFYKLFQGERPQAFAFDVLLISWLGTYLIFHSVWAIKTDRFFAPMAPGFAYLIMLGWDEIKTLTMLLPRSSRGILNLAAMALAALLLPTSLFATFRTFPRQSDPTYLAVKDVSRWLRVNQQDLDTAKMSSDVWPQFRWHLRKNVLPMPPFDDATVIEHQLLKDDVNYYLTIKNPALTSFETVYSNRNVSVFRRSSKQASSKARLFYIGKGWEHYLEDILDFQVFILSGKSSFLDDYDLATLRQYPALLLYNFKWHDKRRAEKLLARYVKEGGSVIIDASANREGPYNLDGDALLKIEIHRNSLPPHPRIRITDKTLTNRALSFSPFVDEEGGSWQGAIYEAFSGAEMEKVVTLNEETLVGVQRLGRGKVYWIGYNLVWHSFLKKNEDEQALIRAIIHRSLTDK